MAFTFSLFADINHISPTSPQDLGEIATFSFLWCFNPAQLKHDMLVIGSRLEKIASPSDGYHRVKKVGVLIAKVNTPLSSKMQDGRIGRSYVWAP
jgi:hypothetical protein